MPLTCIRPAAVVVLLAALACDGGGEQADAGDGSSEGGAERDGGRDARVDAPAMDASVDGAQDATAEDADAGSDAGFGPAWREDAGWVQMSGIPCPLQRARNPEQVYAPEWKDCPGVPGCEYIERQVPDHDENFGDAEIGWHDGSRGYYSVVFWPPSTPYRVMALVSTTGTTVGAWRSRVDDGGLCLIGDWAGYQDEVALVAVIGQNVGGRMQRVYRGRVAGLGSLDEPFAVLYGDEPGGMARMQSLGVSATTTAAQIAPPGTIAAVREGEVELLNGGSLLPGTAPDPPHVVGEHILWEHWSNERSRLAHLGPEGPEVYYSVADEDGDVKGFDTDGEDMAWMEGYGLECTVCPGGYERVELWTAEHVTDPSALAPRKVAELPNRITQPTVGGGYWGYRTRQELGDHRIVLYDLDTGQKRVFDPENNEIAVLQPPVYITEETMLLTGNYDGGSTVFRVQMSAAEPAE